MPVRDWRHCLEVHMALTAAKVTVGDHRRNLEAHTAPRAAKLAVGGRRRSLGGHMVLLTLGLSAEVEVRQAAVPLEASSRVLS
jgi:hypothetical protein